MGKESLVVALNGPWGSGKTSVINLAVKYIRDGDAEKKPKIIHFNPWAFSQDGNMQGHFFDQIAVGLQLKTDVEKDKKITKLIRFYASMLSIVPSQSQRIDLWSKIAVLAGLTFITGSQITSFITSAQPWLSVVLSVIGLVLALASLFETILLKIADIFDKKSEYKAKSLSDAKRELHQELTVRGEKLLVIIDDIDRLDKSDIRQLFRLVRVNANFANTIYLLAFDREVVEKYLDEQVGIPGKDYLGKIVQVNFDIPHVNPSKIITYLDENLNRIIGTLPEGVSEYFNFEGARWQALKTSGFNDFFKSIRDVKRFVNGLEFNISKMQQGGVMEVNPMDFITIEAIRMFMPELYSYMKNNKDILTQNNEFHPIGRDTKKDQEEITEILLPIIAEHSPKIKSLLGYLFPQISSFLGTGYSYSDGLRYEWNKNLRVCSVSNFDCYFTLIPGGADDEIGQLELQNILTSSSSLNDFESILKMYVKQNKIDKLLVKIHDQALGKNNLLSDNRENVIKAMLNIADYLPKENVISHLYGLDSFLLGIIYELLGHNENPHENYQLFKNAAESSKGCIGIIKTISSLLPSENNISVPQLNFSEEEVRGLRELGVTKISKYDWDKLIEHDALLYILYRWKEWDNTNGWQDFLKYVIEDDERYILFLLKFLTIYRRSASGEPDLLGKIDFNFNLMKDFIPPEDVKSKLKEFKGNDTFYKKYQQIIDIVLEAIEVYIEK
ncbi:KAP family P-loop domain protein [Ignavibacteriales bacterium]